MITVVSSMTANEAVHKQELVSKSNELNEVKNHLSRVLVLTKEEMDHTAIKIQNLHYALEGTPMADNFDIKGHFELKKQQVQNLLDQVVELSNELERVESEAARQRVEADRVVEKSVQDTKRRQDIEAHLRRLLEIAESKKRDYLVWLDSNPAIDENIRLQARTMC